MYEPPAKVKDPFFTPDPKAWTGRLQAFDECYIGEESSKGGQLKQEADSKGVWIVNSWASHPRVFSNHVVVHLPALADIVQFPMFGDKQSHSTTSSVDLFATSFIGEGGYGRVYKAALRQASGSFEGLVMKFADPDCEDALAKEAQIYSQLKKLSGTAIPRSYGLFRGAFEGVTYIMLVLSYEGCSVDSFDGLPWLERMTILRKLIQIHQAGIELRDMKTEHVVRRGGRHRLIDFSIANRNHVCPWFPSCRELYDTADELRLGSRVAMGLQVFLTMKESPILRWLCVLCFLVIWLFPFV